MEANEVRTIDLESISETAQEATAEYPVKSEQYSQIYLIEKRLLDVLTSLFGIVLLSPLLLVISIAIKMTSNGPVIYKQERVGLHGENFTIYKFRSMVDGADNLKKHLSPELIHLYEVNRKIENDPRATKVGKLIRRTSLDELPQILNILKGEMSLVGPRPMLSEEIKMYGQNFHYYITVKPGLTGLWQIKSRGQTSMSDRAILDAEYIQNIKLTNDLKIIFSTFATVVSRKGAC